MLRVLMADDQIPDEDVPDHQVLEVYRQRYPGPQNRGFTDAFTTMRELVKTMRDHFTVETANHHADALRLARSRRYDVAIVDLGWSVDRDSLGPDHMSAGWQIIEAIQSEDLRHPERRPTALMIYSARFGTNATISEKAARMGILPFYKPYGEHHSIPLGDDEKPQRGSKADRQNAAGMSLRAVVAFIEELRESAGTEYGERALRQAHAAYAKAAARDERWDRLTRVLITLGVLIVFAGLIALMLGQVQEGVVTVASGAVVSLISKLLFGQLDKVRSEIREAQHDVVAALGTTSAQQQQAAR